MNQELLDQQFNRVFGEILTQELPDICAYFIDRNAKALGPKRFNNTNYYFDLSKIQSQNILGFNHPLSIRSRIFSLYQDGTPVDDLLKEFILLFSDVFGINFNARLIDSNDQANSLEFFHFDQSSHFKNYFSLSKNTKLKNIFIDDLFFKDTAHLNFLTEAMSTLENILIPIEDNTFLLLSKSNLGGQNIRPSNLSNLFFRKSVFSFFLKSNLLKNSGKVEKLNNQISEFSKSNKQLQSSSLEIIFTNVDSIFFDKCLSRGLLGHLDGTDIHLFIPISILDEELKELFSIIDHLLKDHKNV